MKMQCKDGVELEIRYRLCIYYSILIQSKMILKITKFITFSEQAVREQKVKVGE